MGITVAALHFTGFSMSVILRELASEESYYDAILGAKRYFAMLRMT